MKAGGRTRRWSREALFQVKHLLSFIRKEFEWNMVLFPEFCICYMACTVLQKAVYSDLCVSWILHQEKVYWASGNLTKTEFFHLSLHPKVLPPAGGSVRERVMEDWGLKLCLLEFGEVRERRFLTLVKQGVWKGWPWPCGLLGCMLSSMSLQEHPWSALSRLGQASAKNNRQRRCCQHGGRELETGWRQTHTVTLV